YSATSSQLQVIYALSRLRGARLAVKREVAVLDGDLHGLAVVDLAFEDLLGQRVLHVFLDHALQGPRAIGRVVALVAEPGLGVFVQIQRDLAVGQELGKPLHLDVDDVRHVLAAQAVEQDDLVHAVQELGPEVMTHDLHDLRLDDFRILALLLVDEIFGAEIGGDRKSTRLNSSHVKISYAVFCLKKK